MAFITIIKTFWCLSSKFDSYNSVRFTLTYKKEIKAQRWEMACLNSYSKLWHKWGNTKHPAFMVSKSTGMDQIMSSQPNDLFLIA